jgi:hypothetical protein
MSFSCLLVVTQIATYFITQKEPRTLEPFWAGLVPWFSRHILGFEVSTEIQGGDTAYDWVSVLVVLSMAMITTIVWSILDRKRLNYAWLHEWLRVEVRVCLAGAMTVYGADKVFPLQFDVLGLTRLATPVGQLTPDRMLWTFMAASSGYTIMSGLGEVISAALLFVPRVANLGAFVAIGVIATCSR